MNIITPYNDEKLTYNEKSKRYELTISAVKEELGEDLFRDDGVLERRIKKNSKVIYNYIYKCGNTSNRSIVELILNRTDVGRKFMYDVLMTQMEADAETGINTIGDLPRINIKNGQVYDKEAMANGYISTFTQDILDTSASVLGVNIMYQGVYSANVRLYFREYLK